jgi:anaerobic dimethyl sulfoxide reductase subunit A
MTGDERGSSPPMEEFVYTTHSSHCGGACLLKAYVREGVVNRIETDDGDSPQFRGCARGRAYRQRMYSPERLLHPLRRVGSRGEGVFQRVSWDEALGILAGELKRVIETYGAPAT